MTPKMMPPSIHMTKAARARETEIGQASLILEVTVALVDWE